MKKIIYKASSRGHQNHGWLNAKHTFSFANYYNPERIHFGALRVLNDDIIAGGEGFGTHPHDNMEIVTIPLLGALEHQDSMGNKEVIEAGEVQVMSAGTGIRHSEYNANEDQMLNLFQIWIFPNLKDVKPRYDQKKFDLESNKNTLTEVVSPNRAEGNLWLHQEAWLSIGTFDKDKTIEYAIKKKGNGAFIMVIDGDFEVDTENLSLRDAIGVWDTEKVEIKALKDNSRVLVIDIPMTM